MARTAREPPASGYQQSKRTPASVVPARGVPALLTLQARSGIRPTTVHATIDCPGIDADCASQPFRIYRATGFVQEDGKGGMIAALHAARAKEPERLVCAVPVAAPDSLELVRPYADEVVCLEAPLYFRAVGQFYAQFQQVEDEEVTELLAKPDQAPRASPR